MMALQNIDNLLNVFDNTVTKTVEKDKCVENVFTSSKIPMSTYLQIWTYLLNEAPFSDNLVLTSTLFRNITYNHPIFISSFHIRLDPSFIFSKHNHNKFQIGSNTSQAAKKSVIINDVENIISNKHKLKFPFHSLKIFEIAKASTKYQVIPFFNEFFKSIKCLSWSIHNFEEKQNYKSESEDEICIFPQCQLFAIATDGVWYDSIELNDKFPSLYWFTFFLDDTRTKWDQNICDKLQLFLFSHEDTLSIFVLDLNLKTVSVNNDKYNKDNPFTLVLPENIEILVLKCMNRDRNEMFRFDFSLCRHKIKQIVLLNNSFVYVKPLLMDGKGANNLQYFVMNDRKDVNELNNHLLNENVNLFKNTKIKTIYAPCVPKFAFSNVKLTNKVNDIQFVDSFPDLEAVKDIIENQNVRKLFRDLNCKERRHWLWCIFWFDVEGKGIRKLRQLEIKWKLDMMNDQL